MLISLTDYKTMVSVENEVYRYISHKAWASFKAMHNPVYILRNTLKMTFFGGSFG